MASSAIIITNGVETKKVYMGYSWTLMLFGVIPPLCRKEWVTAFFVLWLNIFTFGLSSIIYAFWWNKSHMKKYLNRGWKFKNIPLDVSEQELCAWLSYVSLPMFKGEENA